MRVNRHAIVGISAGAALWILAGATPAVAQTDDAGQGWNARIGAIGMASPRYEGADSYRLRVLPVVRIAYDNRYFLSHHGLGANLWTGEDLELGLAVGYDGGRSSGKDAALSGYRSVGDTAVGRVLVKYRLGALELHADIATDLLGKGHGGTQITTGLRGMLDPTEDTRLMLGPTLTWASQTNMHRFFSTTPDRFNRAAQAGQIGPGSRPGYKAGAGLKSGGLSAILIHSLNARWSVISYAGYTRMMGDAADSPFVRDNGDRNQFSGGLGLSYSF